MFMLPNDLQRTDIVESLFHTFTNAMAILPRYRHSFWVHMRSQILKPMLLSTWFSTNRDPFNDSTLVNPKYAWISDIILNRKVILLNLTFGPSL